MQKEFEKQEKLKSLDESHRAELEKQLQKQEEQHKKHVPVSVKFSFLVFLYTINQLFLIG